MSESDSIPIRTRIILAFYGAGIIVGGGILALPFVALDSGLIFLVFSLIFLAFLFNVIYGRILDSVARANISKRSVFGEEIGLKYYDLALEESNLIKWGKIAFSTGLILYVIPADIVYILYGMKSIMQLSKYFMELQHISLALVALTMILSIFLTFIFKDELTPSKALVLKLLIMATVWSISIYLATFFSEAGFVMGIIGFSLSVIIGEYFPEKLFGERSENFSRVYEREVLPRHKAQAFLSMLKIFLIIFVPILALAIIVFSNSLPQPPPLLPTKFISFVDSISIIMFMYVGSGVYNILVYPWILKNLREGKKLVSYSVIISLLAYLVFSIIIVSAVDYRILVQSDIRREHSFISLSRKLESIGFSVLAYITIALASLFALVSVSVAYIGFTDTLSERFELDLEADRDKVWLLITIFVSIIVGLLEYYNVSHAATDSLGIAGNAGGGLFLIFLPWLMRGRDGERKIFHAIIGLIFVVSINLAIVLSARTLYAFFTGIISTVLVVVVGCLTIVEALK